MRFFVILALFSVAACDDVRPVTDAGGTDGALSDDLAATDLAGADLGTIDAATPDFSPPDSQDFSAPVVATELRFTVQPTGEFSGVPFAVEVALTDSMGRVATTSSCAISIALNVNTQGGLLSGTTAVNTVDGRARFGDLRIDTLGNPYVLTASCAGLPNVSSDSFGVAASRLAISPLISTIQSGAQFSVFVHLEDAAGNIDTTTNPTVTISIYSGPSDGSLVGTVTQPVQSGSGQFAVSLDRAGRYRLKASTATPNISAVTAGPVDVFGTDWVFLDQPSDVVAGTALPSLRVAIQDMTGKIDGTSSQPIKSVTIDGCGASENEPLVDGVATFTHLIPFMASPACRLTTSGVESNQFAVAAGPAAALAIPSPISVAPRYLPLPFDIIVADSFGNQVTSATPDISIAISGTPANAVVSGTTTRTAVGGRAKFTDISIDLSGTYTLVANAPSLSTLTSSIKVAPWGYLGPVAAVDPKDAYVVYGGSNRLLKSTDKGVNWSDITPIGVGPQPLSGLAVVVDPSDSNTVYCVVCGSPYASTSIFHSSDGGNTWDREFQVPIQGYDAQIAISPAKPSNVYVSMRGRVYRTQDSGATWQNTGASTLYGLVASGANTVFASSTTGTAQRSKDSGDTWTSLNVAFGSSIVVDPRVPSHLIAVSAIDTRVSFDGGDTWSLWLPSPTYSGARWAAFDPTDSNTIYADLLMPGDTSMVSRDGGVMWLPWTSPGPPIIAPSNPLVMFSGGSWTATGGL